MPPFHVVPSRLLVPAAVAVWFPVAWSGAAFAQTADGAYTGASLLDDLKVCDAAPSDYRCGRAATYVKGIVRRLAMRTSQTGQGSGHKSFCLAGDVTAAELMNVVREYLDASPAQHAALGAWAVRDAMILQYPCD